LQWSKSFWGPATRFQSLPLIQISDF
jgi:hypothetical protein